jgi:hypothetical protein
MPPQISVPNSYQLMPHWLSLACERANTGTSSQYRASDAPFITYSQHAGGIHTTESWKATSQDVFACLLSVSQRYSFLAHWRKAAGNLPISFVTNGIRGGQPQKLVTLYPLPLHSDWPTKWCQCGVDMGTLTFLFTAQKLKVHTFFPWTPLTVYSPLCVLRWNLIGQYLHCNCMNLV